MRISAFSPTLLLFVIPLIQLIEGDVKYDGRSLIIDGQRRIILSGAIHYPRSTPDMWEDLIQKAKIGGLDAVETYVFWNVHEPSPGNYVFEGRYDLVRFIKTVQKAGLYAVLRMGPYVCAEWNFGGFPVWLRSIPGISFRTDNEVFKAEMQRFMTKVVDILKVEKLFHSQGGPIILSQVENEYGALEKVFGDAGYSYAQWAAKMAVGLETGVPWVMCKQDDAPDPVINSCNGFYCTDFEANKPYKPAIWTEAWTGWFTEFGGALHKRPVQDLAFAVARFLQKGGSFINYYMYHGGTNFGRTAGGPFITTSYDYDAPIDEYGLISEPKYGHLKDLHRAIKLSENAIVSAVPKLVHLSNYQEAFVFSSPNGGCAAFLTNLDSVSAAKVIFDGRHYKLPPWSISILPDCVNEVFNTARIGVQTSHVKMVPMHSSPLHSWMAYTESISSFGDDASRMVMSGLQDQINVTGDASDYLWYMTSIDVPESFLREGDKPVLAIDSSGNMVDVFVNGEYAGAGYGSYEYRRFKVSIDVPLRAGANALTFFSSTVGLQYIGSRFEKWNTGIISVRLQGLGQGEIDLTPNKWSYQVGLRGETMNLVSSGDTSSIEWAQMDVGYQNRQLPTWYKASFDVPEGSEPLALNFQHMGKGQAWVNGQSIGRYWSIKINGNCSLCTYSGTYRPSKCNSGCGQPTQKWYHVPRSWLKPTGNILVIFEEKGGDVSRIYLAKRSISHVCADVSEFHPTIKNWQIDSYGQPVPHYKSRVHLQCPKGKLISAINFASYGTPRGTCGDFMQGPCHSPLSFSVLEKRCLGQGRCSVAVSKTNFGMDPCPNTTKHLAVEAVCISIT